MPPFSGFLLRTNLPALHLVFGQSPALTAEEDWGLDTGTIFQDSHGSLTLPPGLTLPVFAWIRAKEFIANKSG